METSILFIKILSVYFVVSGLFLLIKGKTLSFILKDFFDHPAIVFLSGVILLFLGSGILLINYTNPMEGTIGFLSLLFGWMVLLKGLAYIFMPKVVEKLTFKKFNSWFGVLGVIIIVLGVWLFFLI